MTCQSALPTQGQAWPWQTGRASAADYSAAEMTTAFLTVQAAVYDLADTQASALTRRSQKGTETALNRLEPMPRAIELAKLLLPVLYTQINVCIHRSTSPSATSPFVARTGYAMHMCLRHKVTGVDVLRASTCYWFAHTLRDCKELIDNYRLQKSVCSNACYDGRRV